MQLVWFLDFTHRIDPVPESTLKNIRAVSSRIWNTNRALWLRSLSVAWMTRGLPSSPRTTLLTGAASLIAPTYLLRWKRTWNRWAILTYLRPCKQAKENICVKALLFRPPLIPDLLEDRWAIIDIPHLDDDSGAGLHSGHAQGMHHQKVRRRLLQKQRVQKMCYLKILCA